MTFLHDQVAVRLRALITAQGVATVITEPDTQTPRESILIDFGDTTWEFPRFKGGATLQPFRSEFGMRVAIEVHSPGLSAVATQTRWVVLANAVLAAIRTDPTLQKTGAIAGLVGIVANGSMRGPFTSRLSDSTGWFCGGDITIPVRTDLC